MRDLYFNPRKVFESVKEKTVFVNFVTQKLYDLVGNTDGFRIPLNCKKLINYAQCEKNN